MSNVIPLRRDRSISLLVAWLAAREDRIERFRPPSHLPRQGWAITLTAIGFFEKDDHVILWSVVSNEDEAVRAFTRLEKVRYPNHIGGMVKELWSTAVDGAACLEEEGIVLHDD